MIDQISKDRKGEMVDWSELKKCIGVFVQMGYNNVDIVKEGEDYVWRGDRNI